VTIRPGTADDIAAVLPLVAKTIAFHEEMDEARFGAVPGAHERYEGWMQRLVDSGEGAFLVAEEDGQVVGFILGQVQEEYRMYRTGRYGMIHDLWVEPNRRRRGIARELVLAAIERFREAGVEQVRLDTSAKNEAAQKLFAFCGFRPSVVEMLVQL